ncbi:hypothetical protein THAOC_14835 [Thalassiosira oceanica]|uniref:Uncharacterized protein n=1 Tax=Thalassiosira oceanica TaxID=159749 RepID=K0SGD7_THAOC|nr:hypothetical protein THAOC_14835 [Thalassiosira oceanica]|eukprot:EJK64430.1 hypothetical protein THAOC_14835 [Thalassiosira oceanica]
MLSSRNALELTAILSLCALSFVAFLPYENDVSWGRRYLQAGEGERPFPPPGDYLDDQSANLVYPWAKSNLVPHTVLPDPTKETYMFWHIPKSGGSTAKQIYKCMGLTVTVQSTEESIMKAKDLNLVQSGKVDIIFSSRYVGTVANQTSLVSFGGALNLDNNFQTADCSSAFVR